MTRTTFPYKRPAQRRGLDGDRALRSVAVERVGSAYGLAGIVLRVRMEPPSPHASVVVKLWEFSTESDKREAQVMRAFASRLGTRVPQCPHAGVDELTGRGVLVMEDLRDAVQGDCLDPIGPGQGGHRPGRARPRRTDSAAGPEALAPMLSAYAAALAEGAWPRPKPARPRTPSPRPWR